jgi:hypothetical protein
VEAAATVSMHRCYASLMLQAGRWRVCIAVGSCLRCLTDRAWVLADPVKGDWDQALYISSTTCATLHHAWGRLHIFASVPGMEHIS